MANDSLTQLIELARADLASASQSLGAQIQSLEESLQALRSQQQKLEESWAKSLDALAKADIPDAP